MKKSLFITITAVSALSLAVVAAQRGGGGRPAPAARPSSGPRVGPSNNSRPIAVEHPTIVRPSGPIHSGGDEGGRIGGNNGHVNQPRPQTPEGRPDVPPTGMRPVHVDNRNPNAIRRDPTTYAFRGPHFVAPWRPAGWVEPRWDRFYPTDRIWFDVNLYPWTRIVAVTCQAEFVSNPSGGPNDGALYTADAERTVWAASDWTDEYTVANDTIDQALDQCSVLNADAIAAGAGSCQPIESPEPGESDGCFPTIATSMSH